MTVSAAEGKIRLWRDTSLATHDRGQRPLWRRTPSATSRTRTSTTATGQPGLIRLSTTTGPTPRVPAGLRQHRRAPGRPRTTSRCTARASGALVFSAGTVQWTWGLDADARHAVRPRAGRPAHAAGAGQPARRHERPADDADARPGRRPTKSTDTTGPTVDDHDARPPARPSANGTQVTVTGTATDTGGGVVAGVEVSTDAGATWHPATGTTAWTYTYVQHGHGRDGVRVRAMDDSANIGATATRDRERSPVPCSVFGAGVPAIPAANDAGGAELGLRFTPTTDGFVTGVRFYKGTGNTGTHVGLAVEQRRPAARQRHLHQRVGDRLAVGDLPDRRSPVTAGQTYVASYTAPARPLRRRAVGLRGHGHRRAAADGRRRLRRRRRPGCTATRDSSRTSATRTPNYFVDVAVHHDRRARR